MQFFNAEPPPGRGPRAPRALPNCKRSSVHPHDQKKLALTERGLATDPLVALDPPPAPPDPESPA